MHNIQLQSLARKILDQNQIKRVAIIHDWLVSQRGGENVLDAICELFPDADLYALVHKVGSTSLHIEALKPKTSFLQKIPGALENYRHFLPLFPFFVREWDLSEYDLVLSSSHCAAKGVRKRKGSFHLCYIHAPMRYMWDRFDEYFSFKNGKKGVGGFPSGFVTKLGAHIFRPFLQLWDKWSSHGVDAFIANSQFIAGKVQQYYGRFANVVYPFCEDRHLTDQSGSGSDQMPSSQDPETQNYYIMVTALVPYKRVDLAVDAFNTSGKKLIIVGSGPEEKRLKTLAKDNVSFLGSVDNAHLSGLYQRCKALIFPMIEDFGIVPLEAMAAGKPVIAFGEGGCLETVIDGKTGLFFSNPTPASLNEAIARFEKQKWDPQACRHRAQEFTRTRFQEEYLGQLKKALANR